MAANGHAPPDHDGVRRVGEVEASLDWDQRAVLCAVRSKLRGVTARFAQAQTSLPSDRVSAALRSLLDRGLVENATETTPWFYGGRRLAVFRLSVDPPRPEVWASLPRLRPPRETGLPERLPPQFWCVFWSGLDPMFIRLPEHAVYVATRMLGGRLRWAAAEHWALSRLPADALSQVRSLSEFSQGMPARKIDSYLRWRAA